MQESPRIVLCTLCLNEMEWLPSLYEQHKDWPGLVQWIFIEAADLVYSQVNPKMVSPGGFSTDGTGEYLEQLWHEDRRVSVVRHGICKSADPAQGKCEARQRYLDVASLLRPDWIFVLDADEFYPLPMQESITRVLGRTGHGVTGAVFRQRHLWRPPSVMGSPLLHAEVVGGYWDVPHARAWRWRQGMQYKSNHNIPEGFERPFRYDRHRDNPYCLHLGFASSIVNRAAKHAYYAARGESKSHKAYVNCRAAFETWVPGRELPHGAKVIPYYGLDLECFRDWGHKMERVDAIDLKGQKEVVQKAPQGTREDDGRPMHEVRLPVEARVPPPQAEDVVLSQGEQTPTS